MSSRSGRGRSRRGRGRGRGRGGRRGGRRRGGFGGRGRGRAVKSVQLQEIEEVLKSEMKQEEIRIPVNWTSTLIKNDLFLKDAKIVEHLEALEQDAVLYERELNKMIKHKVSDTFTVATKARILAACFIKKKLDMVDYLLNKPSFCSLTEVLKCIQLLDAPRKARQYQKKVDKLEARRAKKEDSVRQKTISELKTHIHNLSQEPHDGSFSGAKQRKIQKWIKTIPKNQLEFFLLNYPTDSWRALSDIVHVAPKHFQLDYFQSVCFGADPPEDCLISVAKNMASANIAELLKNRPELCQCYSYIRKKLNTSVVPLPDAAKALLAAGAPLDTIIWWYHELQCPEAERIILERIVSGEAISGVDAGSVYGINYGKLMERLLWFREEGISFARELIPYAEERLQSIDMKPEARLNIAVLGDASSSMRVAIKSATIIGTLLSAVLNADLVFFNQEAFDPPCLPRKADDCINVVEAVKARGRTSMASAMWPYYDQKVHIDLFVLVSDEGENTQYENNWLAELFQKYTTEINPIAKIFLASFLQVGDEGKINLRLKEAGVDAKQFRLDPKLPDTSKFDSLLGQVVLETHWFTERWEVMNAYAESYDMPRNILRIIMSY